MTQHLNIVAAIEGKVGVITLNRPKALNALNSELLGELVTQLEAWDRDDAVRCIVLTGSERAFAAGADIKEMAPKSYMDMYRENFFAEANDRIVAIRKPIVAAVAGWALGGGCELAMLCDFIIAADTAKFGQPEITLGVMPGIGGSQRLTRFVGKSQGDGDVPDGPQHGRGRGRARRPRQPRGAGGGAHGRGDEGRRQDRRAVAPHRHDDQGDGEPRL